MSNEHFILWKFTNYFNNDLLCFYSLSSTYFKKYADLLKQNTCFWAAVCYTSKALKRLWGIFQRFIPTVLDGWSRCGVMHRLFLGVCSESACCLACLVSSRKDSHDQKRERESEPSPPLKVCLVSQSCRADAPVPLVSFISSETQQNKVHALLNMKPFWCHGPLVTDESVTVEEIWVSYFASVARFYTALCLKRLPGLH